MNFFVGVAFVGLTLVACSGPSSPSTGAEVPIVRLRAQPYSFTGLRDSARIVVRDAEAWRSMWNRLYEGMSPIPTLPEIDFSKEAIIVAALGQRGSGGYGVIFKSASEDDAGGINVVVLSSTPDRNCGLPTVLTQPVDVARIPNRYASIRFIERNEVVKCGK